MRAHRARGQFKIFCPLRIKHDQLYRKGMISLATDCDECMIGIARVDDQMIAIIEVVDLAVAFGAKHHALIGIGVIGLLDDQFPLSERAIDAREIIEIDQSNVHALMIPPHARMRKGGN
jgi:hypothetical protein